MDMSREIALLEALGTPVDTIADVVHVGEIVGAWALSPEIGAEVMRRLADHVALESVLTEGGS